MEETIYIITGITGYVGNVFAKTLMDKGLNVVGLARDENKVNRVFKDKKPTIIYGDIKNIDDIEKLFIDDTKEYVIIHTVAYVTIGEGDKKELFDVTVGGTKNMLDASLHHKVKKFLHISSTEAIPHGIKLDKDLKNYNPSVTNKKGYSLAKAQADEIVLKYVKNHNLDVSLIMLAGVLGPGDYSNTHMSQVMLDYLDGNLPASIDGGYNDFDIRDVCDVLMNIINKAKKGECYLFANKPDKINEILEVLSQKYNKKMPATLPIWVAYLGLPFLFIWSKITRTRPLYTRAALASLQEDVDFPLSKVEEEFSYKPRPLKETVLDHIEFLLSLKK